MNDREIDALVAEKVMGWVWHTHPATQHPDLRYLRSGPPPAAYGVIVDRGWTEYTHQLPAYSTDIAAAWAVVERMRHPHLHIGREGDWGCSFGGDMGYTAFAPTAPRAICLAALRAVGVEVPQ